MRRYPVIHVVLLFLLITAGCIGQEAQSEQWGYVDGTGLRFNADANPAINGTVSISLTQNESEVFQDVMMCLYSENGQIIGAKNLGDFEAEYDRKPINVTIDDRPRIVVIDHPRFDRYERFGPLVVRWTEGGVSIMSANPSNEITEFSYQGPQSAGECGTTSEENQP